MNNEDNKLRESIIDIACEHHRFQRVFLNAFCGAQRQLVR